MSRLFSIILLTLLPTLALAQDTSPTESTEETSAEVKVSNTFVLVETTAGNIIIELFDGEAPETVKNFLSYVDDGFYAGTIFHRVIPNFMVQAGGFTKELSKKKTKKPIKNEAKEELKNLRGTVAMARISAPDTATSQFFINTKDNANLDYRSWNKGYAVFGKVDNSSLRTVDNMSFMPTGTIGIYRDVPDEAIEILKISRISAEQIPEPSVEKSYFEENYSDDNSTSNENQPEDNPAEQYQQTEDASTPTE